MDDADDDEEDDGNDANDADDDAEQQKKDFLLIRSLVRDAVTVALVAKRIAAAAASVGH